MTTTTNTNLAPLYKRLQALALQSAERAWKDPKAANSAFLQDHAYSLSDCAQQAEREHLPDGDVVTAEQQRRIAHMLGGGHIREMSFGYEPFDLPKGWIVLTVTYADGHQIYAGISPEGEMHT
jgi:hypothetical protein